MEYQVHFNQVEFGKRLREIRRDCGMTQAELAENLMLSSDSISNYENGKNTCMPDHVVHICQLFDISADYFLFGEKKKLHEKKSDIMDKINAILEKCSPFDKERIYQIMLILIATPT